MATKLRKSLPFCLVISLVRLSIGKLRLSKEHFGCIVKMEGGNEFSIFRHIRIHPVKNIEHAAVFIVSFKFARLSHNANRFASIIPMLLITGFPGFQTKMYAGNKKNGFWQGMYQWKSRKALEEYKQSVVFKIMNKRAKKDTINSFEIENQQLVGYIEKIKNSVK